MVANEAAILSGGDSSNVLVFPDGGGDQAAPAAPAVPEALRREIEALKRASDGDDEVEDEDDKDEGDEEAAAEPA